MTKIVLSRKTQEHILPDHVDTEVLVMIMKSHIEFLRADEFLLTGITISMASDIFQHYIPKLRMRHDVTEDIEGIKFDGVPIIEDKDLAKNIILFQGKCVKE